MKKSQLLGIVCACLMIFITMPADAILLSRMDGAAAYDTALDITWTTDAGLSGPGTHLV